MNLVNGSNDVYAAVVPLRGGSKSIPLKNIKMLGGKPLFAWSIDAALASGVFEVVAVSTESRIIKDAVVDYYGPRVVIIDRPAELATDEASSDDVYKHAMEGVACDICCLIQATSPLTRPDDFVEARATFAKQSLDSLLTVVVSKRFFWDWEARPINYDPLRRPRRQDFPGYLMENGAFYLTRKNLLLEGGNRLGGRMGFHVMPEEAGIELDEPSDWLLLETFMMAGSKT